MGGPADLVSSGLDGQRYEGTRLMAIALPVGGIGTGTVSLSGRGRWQDWELHNHPAKGYRADYGFFSVWSREAKTANHAEARVLEGAWELPLAGAHGIPNPTAGLPRFRACGFDGVYPFGRVSLSDPRSTLDAVVEAWNPLIPGDEDASGLPVAITTARVTNRGRTRRDIAVAACISGALVEGGRWQAVPATEHVPESLVLGAADPDRGSMALACVSGEGVRTRPGWRASWKDGLLGFWDAFSTEGRLSEDPDTTSPVGQVLSRGTLGPGESACFTFLLTWYFPWRVAWPAGPLAPDEARARQVRNHYATRFTGAGEVLQRTARDLDRLASGTRRFAEAMWTSDLPPVVREAAMCSLNALRTETCFRGEDGRLYGWEGCNDQSGCCYGSCTHVWNYEWATPILFGRLARSMRNTEFGDSTRDDGFMSFRCGGPDPGRQPSGFAAADGQLGCIVKLYREWQLSGADAWLRQRWPRARAALAYAWEGSGWDRDQDGLTEGCQHHTLDVEYLGPNPLVGFWYLAALRAGAEMAEHLGDGEFAAHCRSLFESGSKRILDLFNGDYFEQAALTPDAAAGIVVTPEVARPDQVERIREQLARGEEPHHQVGAGCLVDQLLGQVAARLAGLGDLTERSAVRAATQAVYRNNFVPDFGAVDNVFRTYATAGDRGLLMVSYPRGRRPRFPVAYFSEAMTGFEYTEAAALIQEGLVEEGVACVEAIRERYDGARRNPYDEAECGHHYIRPMASWAVVLALTGFHYSAPTATLLFNRARTRSRWFWGNGSAWGTVTQEPQEAGTTLAVEVLHGELGVARIGLHGAAVTELGKTRTVSPGAPLRVTIPAVR